MSRLMNILRTSAIVAGTGLVTYEGFMLGKDLVDKLEPNLPKGYLIPEVIEGLTAYTIGLIGNKVLNKVFGRKKISAEEAYSIAALNAFANASNDSRNLTTEKSLENISNGLVEVRVDGDNGTKLGSGLMITTDGYIITAHHVVDELIKNGKKARIRMQNGLLYNLSRENVWFNVNTDIAVIKAYTGVRYSEPIRIKVDQDCKLKRGDEVRVLGFRDGQKYNTMGVITNPNLVWRQDEDNVVTDLFQTDARGKPGQSGGVIANGNGELVGIVVFSSTNGTEEIGVMGGAKISNALSYINQIAAKKSAGMFR